MIEYSKKSKKDLDNIPKADAQRVRERINNFDATNSGNVKPLQGEFEGLHRLAVGNYRAVMKLHDGVVYAVTVQHRQNVYK